VCHTLAPLVKDATSAAQAVAGSLEIVRRSAPMTYFLNFRTQPVGGGASSGFLLQGDAGADPDSLQILPDSRIPEITAGQDVVFAAHGFNVDYANGVSQLSLLDRNLDLQSPALSSAFCGPVIFMGWGLIIPGKGKWRWRPVAIWPLSAINYARKPNRFPVFSHSLAARLVLEAISHITRPDVSLACLTGGAINRFCLNTEYAKSAARCAQISVLASYQDWVLRFLYPIADPFADLLHPDHPIFEAALGLSGTGRTMALTGANTLAD